MTSVLIFVLVGVLLPMLVAWLPVHLKGRRFRKEFNQLLKAQTLAGDEGRWGDYDKLNDQLDDHFTRRGEWIAQLSSRVGVFKLGWDDVKEER
jgi:hypothetical protein